MNCHDSRNKIKLKILDHLLSKIITDIELTVYASLII